MLADLRGDVAVQVGASDAPCLPPEHFRTIFTFDELGDAQARAHAAALPVPTATVDALLLMHVLDREDDLDGVIAEAARVLRGEGRLVVVGLRPFSPAALARFPHGVRTGAMPVGPWRLRAAMRANGLQWQGTRRLRWAYAAWGLRRQSCATPLRPAWKVARRPRPRAVGVPGAGRARG